MFGCSLIWVLHLAWDPEVLPNRVLGADTISSIVFLPDGALLISVDDQNFIYLWNVENGKKQATFRSEESIWCYLAGVCPDGKSLVTLNTLRSRDPATPKSRVIVWDVADRKERSHFDLPPVEHGWGGNLTPDGKTFVAFSRTAKEMRAYEVATGRDLGAFDGSDAFCALAFSPDGKLAATGSLSGTVMLWDLAAQKSLASLKRHEKAVAALAFSPDGKTLATASSGENLLVLWDVPSRERRDERDNLHLSCWSLAFSPDGRSLATIGSLKQILLLDTATLKERQDFLGRAHGTLTLGVVVFSPDGKKLATCGLNSKGIRLWSVPEADRQKKP
jgi:WD40 repeat protein